MKTKTNTEHGKLKEAIKAPGGDTAKILRLRADWITYDPESAALMRRAADEIDNLEQSVHYHGA